MKEIYPQNPRSLRWIRNLNLVLACCATIFTAIQLMTEGWGIPTLISIQIGANSVVAAIFFERFGPLLRMDGDTIEYRKTLFHRFKKVQIRDIRFIEIHLFEVTLTLKGESTVTISLESLTDDPLKEAKNYFAQLKRNLEEDPDFSPLFKVPA